MTAVMSIEQQQKANYAAVRERIMNAGSSQREKAMLQRIAKLEDQLEAVTKERDRAIITIDTLRLDNGDLQATILYQASRMSDLDGDHEATGLRNGRVPPKAIIAEILADFDGISVADVMSHRRGRHLISARHACVYAVHKRRPDLSYPQLGRIFERDHTTILHAVRKCEAERGEK